MGIARSTYYDAPAARMGDIELLNAITAICDEFAPAVLAQCAG